MSGARLTREGVAEWIRDWAARELGPGAARVDPERPLVAYGMDSIHAMMLVGDLAERLGRRLPPTLPWDHPSVAALARHLVPDGAPAPAPDDLLARIDELPEAEIDRLLGERLGGGPG